MNCHRLRCQIRPFADIHPLSLQYSRRNRYVFIQKRKQTAIVPLATTPSASAPHEEEKSSSNLSYLVHNPYDQEILSIAVPTICSGLLSPLCSAVDTAVIGRLGAVQLSGTGVGVIAFLALSSLFCVAQTLITPAVAKADAQDDHTNLSKIIARSVTFGLLVGVLAGISIFAISGPFIRLMRPPAQVMPYAILYLQVLAAGIPPYVLWQCLAGILRGLKDAKTILIASLAATSSNIVLDFLFVFGFGWGVFGAAFATALCTYVSTGMMLHKVLSLGQVKRADFFSSSLPSAKGVGKLAANGAALMTRTATLLSLLVCSSVLISRQGPILHSAFEICRILFLVFHMTYFSFEITMQSLCAFYIGKNQRQSARDVLIRTLQIVVFGISVLSAGLWIFAQQFGRLFTTDLAIISNFQKVAPYVFAFMPIGGIASVLDGSLLAASRVKLVAFLQIAFTGVALVVSFVLNSCQMYNLLAAAILVRIGLSMQSIISWWFSFNVEYKKTVKY